MSIKGQKNWYSNNSKCECLHRQYDKAQKKRDKIKKNKVFKMKKNQDNNEFGMVYPQGTNMKELVDNLVFEYKQRKEYETQLKKDVIDINEFLRKDYYKKIIIPKLC